MVTGNVNAAGEAIVPLRIRDVDGGLLEVDAIVDTGFNGLVAMPPSLISDLRLPYVGTTRVRYADGSLTTLEVREAVVEWDGSERLMKVDCIADEVLVGTALFKGYDLHIAFELDGAVKIERRD